MIILKLIGAPAFVNKQTTADKIETLTLIFPSKNWTK